MTKKKKPESPQVVRCAIYTRKSTEEGLDQEFNSLDAQRESAEAFIASQQHEGWICLPAHYDDGGFTGGNTERPALQRLLADIETGKIDSVVVYKVDRLSRSLLDFAKMIETFDLNNISFVSVTQQFNTTHSLGRLTLNILLSFAQFEREIISERTRDKIAATRRKGKWSGGMPLLGYNVVDKKLVVDPVEADRVRQVFDLYLEHKALIATVKELNRRGWSTKIWTTKKRTRRGGRSFTKGSLYQLLTNVTYLGKLKYKDEVHEGEHQAIVDEDLFRQVERTLQQNGRSGGAGAGNKYGAILRGILHCVSCDCSMNHTYSSKGQRRYRYYVCRKAQQCGWDSCTAPSLSAGEIERFVVDEIKCIGRDPALVAAALAETRKQTDEGIKRRKQERVALERQRRDDEAQVRRLVGATPGEPSLERLAELQDRISGAGRRLTEINEEVAQLSDSVIEESQVAAALEDFDDLWAVLSPREQARVLELLVERVDYDGKNGNVAIIFRATGLQSLAEKVDDIEETAA